MPEARSSLLDSPGAALSGALEASMERLPDLLAALLVLTLGLLLAVLLSRATRRAAGALNRSLDRVLRRGALASARVSPALLGVLSAIVFWIVLLFAIVLALRIAGFAALADWLDRVVEYLPSLVAGGAILALGYLLGVFVRERIAASPPDALAVSGETLGRGVQTLILMLALIIGLDQIGVEVTVLVVLLAVAAGGLVGGLLFAFALGSQHFIGNLIGARNAREVLQAGLLVRIGEAEGTVLEVTSTQIALDTARGKLLLPARLAEERGILVILDDQDAEAEDD